MKNLFLVCLMMLAGSAWAEEWVMYSKTEKDGTSYLDPATILKDGNMRRVWLLKNFNQRNNDGAMSNRNRMEIDCKHERFRFLAMSTHSEPMAGGETLIRLGEANNWMPFAPGPEEKRIFNIVCSK